MRAFRIASSINIMGAILVIPDTEERKPRSSDGDVFFAEVGTKHSVSR